MYKLKTMFIPLAPTTSTPSSPSPSPLDDGITTVKHYIYVHTQKPRTNATTKKYYFNWQENITCNSHCIYTSTCPYRCCPEVCGYCSRSNSYTQGGQVSLFADSLAFYDTMEALGLVQHIDKPTHQLGNTLDHIYTESLDQLGVQHAFIGSYISDHRLVGIEINSKKNGKQLEEQHRCPLKELDLDAFRKEFRNEVVIQHSNLDTIWKEFDKELTRTLDKLAPPRKLRRNVKPARPWYNSRLLGQKE